MKKWVKKQKWTVFCDNVIWILSHPAPKCHANLDKYWEWLFTFTLLMIVLIKNKLITFFEIHLNFSVNFCFLTVPILKWRWILRQSVRLSCFRMPIPCPPMQPSKNVVMVWASPADGCNLLWRPGSDFRSPKFIILKARLFFGFNRSTLLWWPNHS